MDTLNNENTLKNQEVEEKFKSKILFSSNSNFEDIPKIIISKAINTNYCIITDLNVMNFFEKHIKNAFDHFSLKYKIYKLNPGEKSKTREEKTRIENWMLSNNFNRDTTIIAIGGGVVGDIAGFVAATYMRGIDYVQVPTTLLSMVDSSIGGKTAVNTKYAKNSIGAFYYPKAIIININFLATLDEKNLINGMSEIIKISFIKNKQLFELINKNCFEILNKNLSVLKNIIRIAAFEKFQITEKDFKEKNKRQLLNFGHSIGHAIEILKKNFLHGEAVSCGMVFESFIAAELDILNFNDFRRLLFCLEKFKLPTIINFSEKEIEKIIEIMRNDKKNNQFVKNPNDFCKIVLPASIGQPFVNSTYNQFSHEIKYQLIKTSLREYFSMKKDNEKITNKKIYSDKENNKKEIIVEIPGSKSITNRVLLMAALGEGDCYIYNILVSEDTQVMLHCLQKLGVKYEWIKNDKILIHGTSGFFKPKKNNEGKIYLNVKNSGTSARFLLTIACLIKNCEIIFIGEKAMEKRPIGDLVNALRKIGNKIKYLAEKNYLPISVKGVGLKGPEVKIDGSFSSQFISSILISAPYCCGESINVVMEKVLKEDDVTSKQFIEMTIQLMKWFNAEINQNNVNSYKVKKMRYKNPKNFFIEIDATSATYFLGISAITGKTITIKNYPSTNLQGDIKFSKILEKMGCEIKIKNNDLTILSPGKERIVSAGKIDMSSMTDSFMTLAVVSSLVDGTTEIFNIENQKKKECNRIKTMTKNLNRLGIEAKQTKTGLIIQGNSRLVPKYGMIKTQNDHRIGMSFSMLFCVYKDIFIDLKFCTHKTFPNYFNQIRNKFNLKIEEKEFKQNKFTPDKQLIYIIIGMRGVGKTTLAKHISDCTKIKLIDMDEFFEEFYQITIKQFITKNGMKTFRKNEIKLIKKVLNQNEGPLIISTGGGIVTTKEFYEIIKHFDNVININVSEEDILRFENDIVWNKDWISRKILYKNHAKYNFYKTFDNLEIIKSDFLLFFNALRRKQKFQDLEKYKRKFSSFLCCTFENYEFSTEKTKKLQKDFLATNAVEIRIDLLSDLSKKNIFSQILNLRKITKLPIIFTFLPKSAGGNIELKKEKYFKMVQFGIFSGCEFVSIEIKENIIDKIKKCRTKIIASHHLDEKESFEDIEKYFDSQNGDVIKIVTKFSKLSDFHKNFAYFNNVFKFYQKPFIFIDRGNFGSVTRILNQELTPITSKEMKKAASKGQLTMVEISKIRFASFERTKLYLFGEKIKNSLSPAIHSLIYNILNIPFKYEICECYSVSEVYSKMEEKILGGNVTIPFKTDLYNFVAKPADFDQKFAVEKIGAINTIQYDSFLKQYVGYNTDWIGIKIVIENIFNNLFLLKSERKRIKCIIIGAGGTARAAIFALKNLKISSDWIFVKNRTLSKAISLSKKFNVKFLENFDNFSFKNDYIFIINTVPNNAEINWAENLISHKKIILVDLNYCEKTKIISYFKNAFYSENGLRILILQAIKSIEIWSEQLIDIPIDFIISKLKEINQ